KAARDTGEDVAAHHGLVKMIPQWERGGRAPRERYRLLYLKVFGDMAGDLSPGLPSAWMSPCGSVRSCATSLPGPGQVRALEAAALAKPGRTMAPAEIRALSAEAVVGLHQVADQLTELSALANRQSADVRRVRLGGRDHVPGRAD